MGRIKSPKSPQTPKTPKKTPKKSPKKTLAKSPKKFTFQWNDYRRQMLCCLYRFYQCERNVFRRIFCDIFRNHLVERGFPGGQIRYRTLYAQWSWMGRNGVTAWVYVHEETPLGKDREWKDLIQRINESARRLGVFLVEKDEDNLEVEDGASDGLIPKEQAIEIIAAALSQSFLSNSTGTSGTADFGSEDSVNQVPSNLDFHSQTPLQAHVPASVQTPILLDTEDPPSSDCMLWETPCYWCYRYGPPPGDDRQSSAFHSAQADTSVQPPTPLAPNATLLGPCSPEDLPPILYRWSNIDSQGVNCPAIIQAGLFATTGAEASFPEQLSETEFLDYFKLHVTTAKRSTPFISFFRGPLAPIHRGLRNPDGARLFMIDTSKLRHKTFKAAPLVKLTGTAKDKWKGYGEYLVWNEVSMDAIACTVSLTELKRIVSEHSDIGAFLQLRRIQHAQFCRLPLYSDLANHMPKSDDGYAGLLERFTELLGVPGTLRGSVANDFRRAWIRNFPWIPNFPGLDRRAREAVADPSLGENELLAAHTGFTTIVPSEAEPSEASYAPPEDNDSDDSSDSSSNDSRGSEEAVLSQKRDTLSPPWSAQDDSCDEMGETDRFLDDEDAWPDAEEYNVNRLMRWPANLSARQWKGLWEADGM